MDGRIAKQRRVTQLVNDSGVQLYSIQGRKVIAPDNLNGWVRIYNYPAGGAAVTTITGLTSPFGATVNMGQ